MKKKLDYGTILIVGMVLSIMKKVKKIFVLLVMVLLVKNVHAECGYETQAKLNSEAATIKAIYEEMTEESDGELRCNDGTTACEGANYFKVSILNLSENFTVTVKSKNFNKSFSYSDVKNGIASFDLKNIMETHTFTFDVYPTTKTTCPKKKIRTFYLTTPRFNHFSHFGFCQDNPEYYLCEKYVTFEDMEISDFMNKFQEYEDKKKQDEIEKNKNFFQKLGDYIKEHKEVFIGAGCTILVVGGVVIFLRVKRRKDII